MPERKVVERVKGPRGISVRMGNEVAVATKCGPGGSRNVYGSGSQAGMTTREISKGTDILSQFGPDSAGVKGR